MNTIERKQAEELFNTYFNSVDESIISESAKNELKKQPLQWHRLLEQMLLNEAGRLEEQDEKVMFNRSLTNIHERISTKMALKEFVNWLKENELQLDMENGQLTVIPGDGKDRYDILNAFVETFS